MKNITLTHLIIPVLFVSSLTIAGLASANLNEKIIVTLKSLRLKNWIKTMTDLSV